MFITFFECLLLKHRSATAIHRFCQKCRIHELCSYLITHEIIAAAHAVTACDTTKFLWHWNNPVFQLLKCLSAILAGLSQLSYSDIDTSVCVARKLVLKLNDPKGKYKSSQYDLNKLCDRLATSKDRSLVYLPLNESSFKQHVIRASIQTNK